MIITQTPLRISLLGGGTDFPDFYEVDDGCVLSATIDKYVYVILKSRFDELIRVGYTRTEMVETVAEVEHDLVREALRLTGIRGGIEVATMADIPSRGSGLGSSSTVTVGMLHAMWAYQGELPARAQLAEEACRIEIDRLGRPIGKQDQYAAAYGGINFIEFTRAGVAVTPVNGDGAIYRRLGERLMLFFTGVTRRSETVLAEQRRNIEERRDILREMAAQARLAHQALEEGQVDVVGQLMHEGWLRKKQLAGNITTSEIDGMYAAARRAGALGGKISGAGGGGFMLLFCPTEACQAVRAALHGYTELEFDLECEGTLVQLHRRRR